MLTLQLVACGGGGGASDTATVNNNIDQNQSAAILTISWEAPPYRQDGSVLDVSEIMGYRVYTGLTADNLDQTFWINDANQTNLDITQLLAQSFYIAMVVVDIYGVESDLSAVQAVDLSEATFAN
jgi:hypothetical protein